MKSISRVVLLWVLAITTVWADLPSWAQEAEKAKTAGDYPRLISIYQRALHEDPGNRTITLELARSYEAQGRLQQALSLAEQLRESGADVEALLLIGRIQSRRGEREAARDAYEGATRLEPGSRGAYLGLGQVLQQLGDDEGADQAFERYKMLTDGDS